MPTVEDLIGKYVELRDRKAEIGKRHDAELAPLSEAMGIIENALQHQMNELGVTQLKGETGTAFKATSTSCQMADPQEFKKFVFAPVVQAIGTYCENAGFEVRDLDYEQFMQIIATMTLWDMVDFRAGKKGITEYVSNEKQPVPGININTIATINIRRA